MSKHIITGNIAVAIQGLALSHCFPGPNWNLKGHVLVDSGAEKTRREKSSEHEEESTTKLTREVRTLDPGHNGGKRAHLVFAPSLLTQISAFCDFIFLILTKTQSTTLSSDLSTPVNSHILLKSGELLSLSSHHLV